MNEEKDSVVNPAVEANPPEFEFPISLAFSILGSLVTRRSVQLCSALLPPPLLISSILVSTDTFHRVNTPATRFNKPNSRVAPLRANTKIQPRHRTQDGHKLMFQGFCLCLWHSQLPARTRLERRPNSKAKRNVEETPKKKQLSIFS